MQNYYLFRSVLLHEFTHVIDSNRRKNDINNRGWYRMEDKFENTNLITDIIYRLWTPTERNAYTSFSYDKDSKYMKDYIIILKDDIDKIESDKVPNITDDYWREIAGYLFPERLKPNTPIDAIKRYFIKKSRYLLQRFIQKCWQRHGQHYNDKNIIPDMNDMNYCAKNNEVYSLLYNDLSWNYWELFYGGQRFGDWFKKQKRNFPRLTKKLAKYVWNKVMTNMPYDEDDQEVIDWRNSADKD